MALPAFAQQDEEDPAGAGPGVPPLAPISPPAGMPQMPGVPPAAPAPTAPANPADPSGLMEAGNIDLDHRPIHHNPDGSISTVRSASFNFDGKEVLLPTIADDGTPLTDEQAIDLYRRTGKHLGKFDNPDNATAYALKLHEDQAKKYLPLAGMSGGAPGSAPPPIPLTPDGKVDVAAAEKNALTEQGQLTAQGEDAARRKGEAEAKVADAESTAADKEATLAAQHAIDQQKVVDTAAANTQKWLDQAQQDAQKYRGMGLHDYWQDKSTGDKVLAGLSMLFGAAGKTQGGPENNPGMGMIERAVERDFRSQQANIEKARSNVAVDKEQYDLGMTAKQQALADSNLKKANAYDAAAAQLVSFKLKQGVPLAQANTDANVVALRQKGLATRQETLQAIHAQNVADAHLDIERQRADAMTLRAQKYKMRGAGGAGGGGGLDAKAVQFSQWAEQNPKASESQREAMAVKLGIPLQAKAGHTSLKTIEDRISANSKVGGAGDEAKRTITLDDGSKLALPSSKAVPQFVNGYNSRVQAKEKLQALLKDVQANGNVWSADNAARRQALIHDANIAVGSISSMGSSDHSTHLELGTLGPVEPRKNPIWGASNDVGIKLLEDKIKQIDEGTNRTIHSYRNNGEALAAAEGEGAAPAGGAQVGKVMPDGSVIVMQKNKKTGATRQVLKRPDGSVVPVP